MVSNGYVRLSYNWCIYIKEISSGMRIYLLLYVDDILIAGKSKDEIDKLKSELNSVFDMKNLGHAKKILDMEIVRTETKQLCT